MQVHDVLPLLCRTFLEMSNPKGLLRMVIDITRPLNRGPRIQIHHALLCPSDIYRVLPIKSHVDGMPSLSSSTSAQLSRILPHASTLNFCYVR
jgi:hypothetical protein